jgi:hypothetical protein
VIREHLATLTVGLALLTSCGGPAPLVLDGSPRTPDTEGVVTKVTTKEIQLDGRRSYHLSRDLQSFSTYTLTTIPVLQSTGRYVQLGLDGDTATWIATVGAVIEQDPRVVVYTGELAAVRHGRLVFRDGTVLQLDKRVSVPKPQANVVVDIDPARHRAVKVKTP